MSGKRKRQRPPEKYEERMPLSILRERLPAWYEKKHRNLPWRGTGDPYDVWISEIMCQQTRISAVIDYFNRFKKTLPDVQSLAGADDEKLMKLWEGLGYYSRARNLKKAAGVVMEKYGGKIPSSFDELMKLPGIGSYTAGAIASIAFGERVPAVDGNVLRVCSRVSGNERDIADPAVKKALEARLGDELTFQERQDSDSTSVMSDISSVNPPDPGIYNQALMELGALVCLPNGEPLCGECPVRDACYARIHRCTGELPVKRSAKKRRIEKHTVLLVRYGEQVLIRKRPDRGLLAGLWEFPLLDGELKEDAALDIVREWGLDPVRIKPLFPSKHIFSHIEWRMTAYQIRVADFSGQTERLPAGIEAPEADGEDSAAVEKADAEGPAFDEKAGLRFADRLELLKYYSIPSAFSAYTEYIETDLEEGLDKRRFSPVE